ncbi:MAG: glycosyltransferase [Cyanobacteria bacterium]|nr:glycosyltransferase [Cyanobacteriota bacterium]MDA1020254.1 glycosyltransferase [Cyanobacteriota bacterium]
MTIYIYDPNIMQLGENVLSVFLGKRAPRNLKYLLELIQEKDDILILTDYLSTYAPIRTWSNFPIWLRRIGSFLDIHIWCLANKVPFSKVKTNINQLNPTEDIIFTHGTINSIFESRKLVEASSLIQYQGKVLVYANHFFTYPEIVSANYKLLKNPSLAAETKLENNSFFQKFFSDFGSNYVLPYAFQERFETRIPFQERKNKALALGTYLCLQETDPGHKEVIQHFNSTALHPMRKAIYEARKHITEQIDSIISKQPFEDDEEKNRKAQRLKGIGLYLFKLFAKEQEKYLSLDIVDQYNQYKMVIAPEEIIGLPSISFVEAMSCNCAYIGIDSEIYTDLGLEANKHYISYNGTLENLLEKVRYYQEHSDELEEIANNGYKFVREYLSDRVIKEKFYQDLKAVNF